MEICYKNVKTEEEKIFVNEEEEKEFTKSILPSILINFAKDNPNLSLDECVSKFSADDKNWNKYSDEWKIAYMAFDIKDFEPFNIKKETIQDNKVSKNSKTKSAGNGEGSLYYSEALGCWVYQYHDASGKRRTMKQRKNETVKHFKQRVVELKAKLNNGTYIEKKSDTVKSIIEAHIKQKLDDGTVKGVTYSRDLETLEQLERCCKDFINNPIQKVTLNDIQNSKKYMKKYAKSGIDRMWRLLKKAFAIASSPSNMLIPYNIMNDENLKKPVSEIGTKKIFPLTAKEREKLNKILDNEERNHKYRDIIKVEWLTAMRIGEVLARGKKDLSKDMSTLHIHNTLTKDENKKIIVGEHTKTYNKETGIDEGERHFPLTKELKEIFKNQKNKKLTNIYGLLFWDYQKNTFISDKEINAWLRIINEKYHIANKKQHKHRLRQDRITQWKESNMDMKAIQYLAGHIEDSKVTDDYIDISQEYAFKEFEKANV